MAVRLFPGRPVVQIPWDSIMYWLCSASLEDVASKSADEAGEAGRRSPENRRQYPHDSRCHLEGVERRPKMCDIIPGH